MTRWCDAAHYGCIRRSSDGRRRLKQVDAVWRLGVTLRLTKSFSIVTATSAWGKPPVIRSAQ
jgi:hypothetical protein